MNATANQTESVLTLLLDAPDEAVESCQRAMKHVAAGEWRDASRVLSYAADLYEEGHVWGDRAAHLSAILRAKA